jgi:hypothetical protein
LGLAMNYHDSLATDRLERALLRVQAAIDTRLEELH